MFTFSIDLISFSIFRDYLYLYLYSYWVLLPCLYYYSTEWKTLNVGLKTSFTEDYFFCNQIIVWNMISGHIFCHIRSPLQLDETNDQRSGNTFLLSLILTFNVLNDFVLLLLVFRWWCELRESITLPCYKSWKKIICFACY